MSLIGEALKKAHLEAVRQDGSRPRLAHTPGVAQYRQPHGGGKRSWTTALIASNLLLALLVAGAIIWRADGGEEPAVEAIPALEAATSADRPVADAAAVVPVAETPAQPAPGSTPERAAAAPVAKMSEPARESAGTEQGSPATPAPPERATAQPAPAAVADTPPPPSRSTALKTVDGLVAGQTYMRSVPVPGGSELVLSGMSVVGDRGVALINSRMVREGDRVGPFVVGTIGDRRVALDYKGITVYLKMP